jgi:serine/threonine protein phosphatase PrpC
MAEKTNLIQGKYLTGVSSVVGDTRRQYEDRAKIIELTTAKGLNLFVAIVADGVGSADNGGLAAQLSIDSVISYMKGSEETDIALLITNSLKFANYVVYKDVVTRDVDASTTLTVGVFYHDRFFFGNVGDSRAYWIQESGKIIQLTMDHSYFNIKGGDPTSSQAETLVNAIGIRKDVYADIGLYVKDHDRKQAAKIGVQGLPLKVGDTIILCSDGLIKSDLEGNRYVADEEILQALESEIQPNAAAVKMTGLAEGRYVDDNVSVITVQYTTVERIENTFARQRRKTFMQRLIYAGLALVILAGIVWGSYLLKGTIEKDKQINELANAPTSTPIFYTPQATTTPTAHVMLMPGELRINEIGSFTPMGGYQKYLSFGYENPVYSILGSNNPSQKMVSGTNLPSKIAVETFENVGVMLLIGASSGEIQSQDNHEVYVYGGSSLTLNNEQGTLDMNLNQGAIFINMKGRSGIADLGLPSHGGTKIRISGGSMLVTLEQNVANLWCLREECLFDTGNSPMWIREQEIRVYNASEGTISDPELLFPPSERYEEYLNWNNNCNQCLLHVNANVPTPTPTPIVLEPTDNVDNSPIRSPIASLTAIPTKRTITSPTNTLDSTRPIINTKTNTLTPESTFTTKQPPVEPTKPPVKTTKPPVKTTEPPVETTEPPIKTTEPPVETTEPPVKTTEPPVETTEPPVETTEPPVETTEPPVEPSEPPVEPSEPPVEPSEPPVEPSEPPVEPSEPPVEPSEPPVEPSEPPVEPSEPPVEPSEPPVEPSEPPVEPSEPPVEANEL